MTEGLDAIGAVGAASAPDFTTSRDSGAVSSAAPSSLAPTRPSAPPAPTPPPSAPTLQAAVQQINTHLAAYGRVMELRVDLASGLTVAAIRNSETGAVLQQMPSEDVLRLAEMLRGWSHGKDALLDLMA
jgi:hypothetical protein